MISLYIHIPFCYKKCSYCNFLANPVENINNLEDLYDKYLIGLKRQIDYYSNKLDDKSIKTIYIGGGTPLVIGKERLFELFDYLFTKFDLQELEEFNIELNPTQDSFEFIKLLNKKYQEVYRIRYSFGIQSFDDEVLKNTNRDYYFNYLVGYLRNIVDYKRNNNIFNFDFIAFGKFNKNKKGELQLWDFIKMDFFVKFVESGFADSFSLYTLELFPGSVWYSQDPKLDQENIYKEFELLKNILLNNGYKRYELSNFAYAGKSSIHNRVYWQQKPYLGLGIGASSYLISDYLYLFEKEIDDSIVSVRFENTKSIDKYFNQEFISDNSIVLQTAKDQIIEDFFLRLRTDEGIKNLDIYNNILVKDIDKKLGEYKNQGFISFENNKIVLTDEGMNVYNSIITDLLKDI